MCWYVMTHCNHFFKSRDEALTKLKPLSKIYMKLYREPEEKNKSLLHVVKMVLHPL